MKPTEIANKCLNQVFEKFKKREDVSPSYVVGYLEGFIYDQLLYTDKFYEDGLNSYILIQKYSERSKMKHILVGDDLAKALPDIINRLLKYEERYGDI